MPIGQAKFGLYHKAKDKTSLILLETKTLSNAAATFTSLAESTYTVHLFVYSDLQTPSSTQTEFSILCSTDGGSSYASSNYEFANKRGYFSGTFSERQSQGQASIRLMGDVTGDVASAVGNGYCYMYSAGASDKYTFFTSHNIARQSNSAGYFEFGTAVYENAATVNAVKIAAGADGATNIASGKISLYGIKESF